LERIWKEAVLARFWVLSQHSVAQKPYDKGNVDRIINKKCRPSCKVVVHRVQVGQFYLKSVGTELNKSLFAHCDCITDSDINGDVKMFKHYYRC
jgi:hypothetical protein